MTYRTLLPVAAAIGVSVSIVGCGRGDEVCPGDGHPTAPARGGSSPAGARPGPGPDCRSDCRVAAPFCRRRAGARPRASRAGADILRSRHRGASEVAHMARGPRRESASISISSSSVSAPTRSRRSRRATDSSRKRPSRRRSTSCSRFPPSIRRRRPRPPRRQSRATSARPATTSTFR